MSRSVSNYVLCSTPRSGTTLLCTMLEASGVAGRPNSFFREKSLREWCEEWAVLGTPDPKDPDFTERYFAAMWIEGQGGTPVFGLRLMGPDLAATCQWLALRHPTSKTDRARFDAAFGPVRFVYLRRHDKLAEAVSYLRAEQTGLWHQNSDGSDMERIAPSEEEGFRASAITERLNMLQTYDAQWDTWFDKEGIDPLRLSYEDLAEDPNAAVGEVLAFIGQDPDLAQSLTPPLRKLADATTADWIERYNKLFPNRRQM